MPRTFRYRLVVHDRDGFDDDDGRARSGSRACAGSGRCQRGGAGGDSTAVPPGLNDVVATITVGNQTDKVTKGEVINFLSRYPLPDENREAIYRAGHRLSWSTPSFS